MSGSRPIAIDLTQAQSAIALLRIKPRHWPRVLDGLRVMENAALHAMYGDGS